MAWSDHRFTDAELSSVERGAAQFTVGEQRAVAQQFRTARAFLRYVADAPGPLDLRHLVPFLRSADPEWAAKEATRTDE